MKSLFVFLFPFIILCGCKNAETITPSSSSSNPLGSIPSSLPGVYVGGNDGLTPIGYGVGKIWKNEDVLFSSSNTSLVKDIFIYGNDVYAVGMEYFGNKTNATLWKNGIATTLGDKVTQSYAYAIFVSGNDVYVCGKQNNSAVIWKNGIPSILDPNGELYTIFVSGNDVYTSGSTGLNNDSGMSIFKNGKSIYFEKQGGFPTGMFVTGNDVYVTGYGTNNGSQAKLWKNGTVTIIDKVSRGDISANGIFVSGSDIYIVGNKYVENNLGLNLSVAVLWKNGVATNLTDGNSRASANDIFVTGGDVYICGYEFVSMQNTAGGGVNNGKIWKNGIPTVVSKSNNNLIPTSIFIVK
jgi:hypothetical protein